MEDLTQRLVPEEPARQEEIGEQTELRGMLKYSPDERRFGFDEYFGIIDLASQLQIADERKRERAGNRLEGLTEDYKVNGVPESRVYEFATQMGIPKEYVDKAISLRKPSEEEMIRKLRELGGDYDYKDVAIGFKKYLLRDLETKYPGESFGVNVTGIGTCDIIFYRRKSDKRGRFKKLIDWLRGKHPTKELIAGINIFHDKDEYFVLYSPEFLEACHDTIKKINKEMGADIKEIERKYRILLESG